LDGRALRIIQMMMAKTAPMQMSEAEQNQFERVWNRAEFGPPLGADDAQPQNAALLPNRRASRMSTT
jgi:hypothetical protein